MRAGGRGWWALLAAVAAWLLGSSPAHAINGFQGLVPNGQRLHPGQETSCQLCHVQANGGAPWNPFGADIRRVAEASGKGVWSWSDVCALDSDDDGQTNGQELGDPLCRWVNRGDPIDRTTDLSLPGDPDSTSADPDGRPEAPPPDAGAAEPDAAAAPSPPPSESGCSVYDAGSGAASCAMALVLLLVRRRRRMRGHLERAPQVPIGFGVSMH